MLPPDTPPLLVKAAVEGLPNAPGDWVGSVVGGAVWGLGMLVASIIGLHRYLKGHDRALKIPPEEELTVKGIELADTTAISDKIIAHLSPRFDQLYSGGMERDRRMDMILEKLQNLENEQEVARRARDEVARQLADERRRRE